MRRALSVPLTVSLAAAVAACGIVQWIMRVETRPSGVSSAVSSRSAPARVMKSAGAAGYRRIDISHHDTVTDWSAVKKNVDGVYIKATESTNFTDPQLATSATAATGAGIPVGFYHFFQPTADPQNARDQAQMFHRAIQGYAYRLMPVLDTEESNGLTTAQVCADVKAFADEFYKLSAQPIMIYCSPEFADAYLADKSLSSYPLWVAHYNVLTPRSTGTWDTYVMWQYDDSVSVAGVRNPVDGDVATEQVFLPAASSSSSASSSVSAAPAQELMVR